MGESVVFERREYLMKYTKPAVLKTGHVLGAKCGSGPCGRPCDDRA